MYKEEICWINSHVEWNVPGENAVWTCTCLDLSASPATVCELSWGIPASAAFKLCAQEDTITVDILKEAASGISSSSDHGMLIKQSSQLLMDFASGADVSDSALRKFLNVHIGVYRINS